MTTDGVFYHHYSHDLHCTLRYRRVEIEETETDSVHSSSHYTTTSTTEATLGGAVPELIANLFKFISYFLAVTCRPFFWIVFKVRVEMRSFTNLLPSSHHSFRVCKFTNWNFRVCAFDFDTLFALLRRVPAMSHALSCITSSLRTRVYKIGTLMRRKHQQ